MLLGKRPQESNRRGLPISLRRQMLLLFALLLGLGLVGLQFLSGLNRQSTPLDDDERVSPPGFGAPLEPSEPGGGVDPLPAVPEPQPPEPFERKTSLLARGTLRDRTETFAEPLIAYLFQKVRTREDFYGEKPVLSLDNPGEKVWHEVLDLPNKYRGKLVEVKGEVLSPGPGEYPLHLRGLEFPNPSGLDRAYQSYIIGSDGKYYMAATARKQRELSHRDSVRLRGYFCQLYTYPVEYQGETVKATIPLLVGDDYQVLPRPTTGAPWTGEYLPLLGAMGLFAVVAVILIQRQSDRRYEARRLEARTRKPPFFQGKGFQGKGRFSSRPEPTASPGTPPNASGSPEETPGSSSSETPSDAAPSDTGEGPTP